MYLLSTDLCAFLSALFGKLVFMAMMYYTIIQNLFVCWKHPDRQTDTTMQIIRNINKRVNFSEAFERALNLQFQPVALKCLCICAPVRNDTTGGAHTYYSQQCISFKSHSVHEGQQRTTHHAPHTRQQERIIIYPSKVDGSRNSNQLRYGLT